MTLEEFSNNFDTLLNSYNIQAGFGEGANKQGAITLDEYEKSVLLTQAQDMIVKSYFDRTLNSQQQGFDDSARRQVDFSSLIKVKKYTPITNLEQYDDRSYCVTLDKKILFVLNEKLEVTTDGDKKIYIVVPLNYREYDREMSKAYAQPLKKQAWRLFSNASTGYDIKSEIIPIYGTVTPDDSKKTYYRSYKLAEVEDYEWYLYTLDDGNEVINGVVDSQNNLPTPTAAGLIYMVDESLNNIAKYVIRYVERPTPIILRPLPDGLTIDGYDGSEDIIKAGCSLNPILHTDILNRAYELALTTRGGGTAMAQSQDNRQQREE